MKKLLTMIILLTGVFVIIQTGCKKEESITGDSSPTGDEMSAERGVHVSHYNSDLVTAWMKMHLRIMSSATGIPNVAFCRPYAYSGIALYEAIVPGMPLHKSLENQLNGMPQLPNASFILKYYWPSSGNAAMALILKKMYPATSAANVASIDSLENALSTAYSLNENAIVINRSVNFGRAIAQAVYDWAQTDGYLNASAAYTPPAGPGLWVPTPPAFGPASTPYWGNVRTLVPNSGNNSQPAAPVAYSEVVNSGFYNMAKQVYDVSQTLTVAQTEMALFWRDIPGPTTPGHYMSILQQVLETEQPSLDKAAIAYAYCAITINDAAISCWKTKYNYNLVRPVTYIINVLGHTTWVPLLGTPGHPEYSSAHAALSSANAEALTRLFGNNYSFTDHTNDYLGMAPRTFSSFRACGEDAGNSRLYAGIHYQPSIDLGLTQGIQVESNIKNSLRFKRFCNGPF